MHSSNSEEILEKKNTSKPETKNTTKNTQAYHLNNSDHLGTPLVAELLNGENYLIWVRSIKTALCVKTKVSFIDGSIKKPSSQSEVYHDWEKANLIGTTWLINVTEPNLYSSIPHASRTRDMWVGLEECFVHTNAPLIH